jgi:DNA replication protein DnaC
MNLIELERSLRQLRLGGMADTLETRLRQAKAEPMAPIDLIASLVTDELNLRSERLIARRRKQAAFRDPHNTLDNFDFSFNPKMNRSLVFDLATAGFIAKREDALFLGPGGTGKVTWCRQSDKPPFSKATACSTVKLTCCLMIWPEAIAEGTRKEFMESLTTVPLLIIDDFGMRELPHTAAEDLLEIIMRRYERASTLLTSNRPVEDWGKLLGDVAAVTAMLDRLLHHGHVLKCGPRSWRTKAAATQVAVAALPAHPTQEAL